MTEEAIAKRQIVERLIDEGILITVGYGTTEEPTRSTDSAQIMGAPFACDEERLRFHEVIIGVLTEA